MLIRKLLLTAASAVLSTLALAQNTGIGTISPTDQLHTTGSVRFEGYKGTGTRLLQVDSNGRLTAQLPLNSVSPVAAIIPDNACSAGNGVTSAITINTAPPSITTADIVVRINIAHTYDGDLYLYLVAPDGSILCLTGGIGGAGDNYTNTIFTDAGATVINSGSAPFSGSYKPLGSLAPGCTLIPTVATFGAIGGGVINPNGVWTLKAYDAAIGDVGTLLSWDIYFGGLSSFNASTLSNYIPRILNGAISPSAISQSAVNNNIGIGTTMPGAALDVLGTFHVSSNAAVDGNLSTVGSTSTATLQVTGGTPSTGKVLTATGTNGTAAWQAPAAFNSAFEASMPANTSTTNNFTFVTLPFTAASSYGYDDGGAFNNITNAFVAPATGVYHFDVVLTLSAGGATATSAGNIQLSLAIGSTENNLQPLRSGDDLFRTLSYSTTLKLIAGTSVQVQFRQNVLASGLVVQGVYSRFRGYRVY